MREMRVAAIAALGLFVACKDPPAPSKAENAPEASSSVTAAKTSAPSASSAPVGSISAAPSTSASSAPPGATASRKIQLLAAEGPTPTLVAACAPHVTDCGGCACTPTAVKTPKSTAFLEAATLDVDHDVLFAFRTSAGWFVYAQTALTAFDAETDTGGNTVGTTVKPTTVALEPILGGGEGDLVARFVHQKETGFDGMGGGPPSTRTVTEAQEYAIVCSTRGSKPACVTLIGALAMAPKFAVVPMKIPTANATLGVVFPKGLASTNDDVNGEGDLEGGYTFVLP